MILFQVVLILYRDHFLHDSVFFAMLCFQLELMINE